MILGGVTVQIVEFKPNEAWWNSPEKLCRETQRMSLAEQLTPHPVG
jgi:hypothetical protein